MSTVMIDACALYFPTEEPPLKSALARTRSDGGLFRSPTWLEYDTPDGPVRLNLQHDKLADHLRGFKGYVARLANSGQARAKAHSLIESAKACVGVVLPHPIASDSAAFQSLVRLLALFNGFMFVNDGIMLADGSYLVGPMAETASDFEEPPLVPFDPNLCKHLGSTEGVPLDRVALRERHYRLLAERGFRCARWLPLYRGDDAIDGLRPLPEIVSRLFALKALFLWIAASEDAVATDDLLAFVQSNGLRQHLIAEEQKLLALPRADMTRAHRSQIGWRLENMWALSWILGFEPEPPFFQGQIPESVIDRMLREFLPNLDITVSGFLLSANPRGAAEVGALEDLYYCAHNAVRGAQLGEDTVPHQFHPVRDGGAVHERRHALTWALSPGTSWENADLST